MTVDPRRCGDNIAASAGELARLWRSARARARPGVFPGRIDALVEPFVAAAGAGLAVGAAPSSAVSALAGVVRVDLGEPAATAAELDAELDLLSEVLSASCGVLDADDATRSWLSAAIAEARQVVRAAVAGGAARGLVIVHQPLRVVRANADVSD